MIKKEYVFIDLDIKEKDAAMEFIAKKAFDFNISTDKEGLLKDLYKREEEFNTDLGMGISIPHTKSDYAKKAAVIFLRYKNEILWGGDTKVKASIVFISPKNNRDNIHLKMLSRVSRKLVHQEFLGLLLNNTDKDFIYKMLFDALNEE